MVLKPEGDASVPLVDLHSSLGWAAGEANPWAQADCEASWRRTSVDAAQWRTLRDQLRREAQAWRQAAGARRDWEEVGASGALASAAHAAYHLGAVRQILAGIDLDRRSRSELDALPPWQQGGVPG